MSTIDRTLVVLFFLSFYASENASAQFVPSKYEVGFNVGTLIYQGDLSVGVLGYTKSLKPAINLWGSKSYGNYFSLRANIVRGEIGANEATYSEPVWRSYRAFEFTSSVTEFSVVGQWDLFGKTYNEGMHRLSPYFFVGAGVSLLNVKRNWSHFDAAYFGPKSTAVIGLGEDTLHATPSAILAIPIGMGLRYMVTNHIYINAEGTYRITNSDYIDGFKYAANPSTNDHYYGVSIGVSYRFGKDKSDCPKVPI